MNEHTEETNVVTDDLGEEHRVLMKTQRIREFIIDQLTVDGTEIPKGRQMDQLIMTLEGFDRQALTLRKLRAEELAAKGGDVDKAVLAALLKSIDRNREVVENSVARASVPTLPDEITVTSFLPGELKQGTVVETHEEFVKRRTAERGRPE